jgi:hypothetical protein
MKVIARLFLLSLICLAAIILTITACGGNSSSPSTTPGAALKSLVLNGSPVGFQLTHKAASTTASISSMFVANAQTVTPIAGNFPGFCNALAPTVADHRAAVLFGIGRWTSGSCDDAAAPDSDVGVSFQQAGQIGNLTVDAVGIGSAADSGQMEVKLIHADGTQTIVPMTCTLGISTNPTGRVHCEDKQAVHVVNVAATDQMSARIFYNAADSFTAIRVNIAYASPTF